jgi:SAM-dependent methyltransferase
VVDYAAMSQSTRPRIVRSVQHRLDIPPEGVWPFTLPGAPALHERRWASAIRRCPVITVEEHAARVGVGELEEVIGCSLCGERRVQPLLSPRHPEGKFGYEVVRCVSCGLLFRHPGIRPDRLGELYSGGYGRFLTGHYERRRTRRYRLVMDAFSPVFDAGEGRRLLDYGCGAGHFLELAEQRGFDACGVDLSPDAVRRARRRRGVAAFVGNPADVPEVAAGDFDAITMWSVLAHLATPVEDLTTLRGLLADDGVLLVLTVNANSLVLKARRDAWNGFTKNHLKFFAPETLALLLRRAGFGAVVMRPMYGDAVEAGRTKLSPRNQRRLRRAVDAGNRGNMLRAVAFADPDGPRRWGLERDALRL